MVPSENQKGTALELMQPQEFLFVPKLRRTKVTDYVPSP